MLNLTLTTVQSDMDRVSDKIDHLVRTLYYKKRSDVVDELCLLKAHLFTIRKLREKERKKEILAVEETVMSIQLKYT